ncbi:replication initiation protein [Roseomonas populi]|uniref:Replication protein RepA n=1 Tax=Roseomonas populi TaxID=3121582 RepID=A0ABT1WYI8_9PROT|nr:replication protein RepA [Roseomonas pecuniae]MCR0980916.1 replication protein RepA [Roseomonas pecuniae]
MMSRTDPAVSAESDRASAPESVLWQHAAFCRLALPLEPVTEAWRREGVDAALRIAPGAAGETLPDGAGLRLLLAFLCDSALRAGSATVALGADAAALAARMGLSEGAAAPLAEQLDRLLGARITVSVESGPELAVLDARSRPRGGGWPAQIRLNARFLASLEVHAVPLDRGIQRALSGSAEAMDAHAWTREALARAGEGATVTTPWPELQARFGAPGATAEAFREAFEGALRLVFEADLSIELAVDDDGVSVRRAQPGAEAAPAPAPAAPEPAPAPVVAVPAPAPVASVPAPVPAPAEAPAAPTGPAPAAAEEIHPREERRREDRQRDERQRDDRPREDRPRDERPRDDRPREDRIRDDRNRDDRRNRRDEGGEGPVDGIVDDMIRLRSHLTGLPQVVWLRRGHGDENILVGVTPGTRMDTDRLTILMVEPIVMQVSGGLGQNDFDRVSAWVMANRDLIDEFWEGSIVSAEEVNRRVRKAPGPTWR